MSSSTIGAAGRSATASVPAVTLDGARINNKPGSQNLSGVGGGLRQHHEIHATDSLQVLGSRGPVPPPSAPAQGGGGLYPPHPTSPLTLAPPHRLGSRRPPKRLRPDERPMPGRSPFRPDRCKSSAAVRSSAQAPSARATAAASVSTRMTASRSTPRVRTFPAASRAESGEMATGKGGAVSVIGRSLICNSGIGSALSAASPGNGSSSVQSQHQRRRGVRRTAFASRHRDRRPRRCARQKRQCRRRDGDGG